MFSVKEAKKVLERHKISPNKVLGQNFLIDEKVADELIEAAGISKKDFVVEIGPGLGFLTTKVAKEAGKVLAVEKDKNLASVAKEETPGNVKVVTADFLEFNLNEIKKENYKVVSNLPFYAANPIIRKLIKDERVTLMSVITQKEVAERINAEPPEMNFLALIISYFCKTKIISKIKGGSFWPSPEVDAAAIRFKPRNSKPNASYKDFFKIAEAGFKHPRKQIKNNLSYLNLAKREVENSLKKMEIDPKKRPQNLTVKKWEKIASELKIDTKNEKG